MVDDHIDRPFPDVIPVLERWFDGLTRRQLIFFEQYWRMYGPRTAERDIWEALKRTPERKTAEERPSFRKEVVVIKGHRVRVWRDLRTGRFIRRRRKK